MRIKMIFSYDGTNFIGYQKQVNERTVQGEIEKKLSQIFSQAIIIHASGRTDLNVHALRQVAHFDIPKEVDLGKLRYSLNCILPKDIHVISLNYVSDEFHARYCALKKTYKYILNMGEANPFFENYRYEFKRQLDVDKMKECANLFVGEHNFQNFTTKEVDLKQFVRTIFNLDIEQDGNIVTFVVTGTGFMKHMVRMIVGTLVQVGLGKIDIADVRAYFNDDRRPVNHLVPGCGLYLVDVFYREDDKDDTL